MTIARNVEATKHARLVLSLSDLDTPEFWAAVRRIADERCPLEEETRAEGMDDGEARRFEAVPLSFGRHAGQAIGAVPAAYLLYLTENDFQRQLYRYVKSKAFERRQESEEA